MLQSAWRMKRARAHVSQLRQLKAEKDEKERTALGVKVNNAQALIFNCCLRIIARIRMRKVLMGRPQVFFVQIKNASNINIGDQTTSDPFVYVSCASLGATGAQALTKSLFKSSYKAKTLDPVWNEEALVCNVLASDVIVLTIADHDNFSANDFLGQVTL